MNVHSSTTPGSRTALLPSYVLGFLCLALPTALVSAYTLNLFYKVGIYFWDAGLFVHLVSFTDTWPMLWPDFLHHIPNTPRVTFFSIHFMPFLYLTSAIYQLVSFIPPAAYFSLLQGLWAGLIGLSVFILCVERNHAWLATGAAVATALCGPMLAALGYPHIEPAIPALLLLFFALRSAHRQIGAWIALGLCLSVREDAGFHAGAFIAVLAAAQWVSGSRREAIVGNLLVAVVCVVYSLAALSLPILWFPRDTSLLETVFVGRPLFAHVTRSLVIERLTEFLTDRAYVTWPLLTLLGVALWRRNALLLAGVIAPLPWLVLLLLAKQENVSLWGYYSFPLIVSLAWPAIVLGAAGARWVCGLSSFSVVLFATLGGPNADRAPWRLLSLPDFSAIGGYERALIEAVDQRGSLGRLYVDDGVTILVSNSLKVDEWLLQWSIDKLPDPDVIIFREGGVRGLPDVDGPVAAAIKASGLTHRCRIANAPFVVASRTGTSICR